MNELKLFILRLLAAAFLVAFCMTVSRAADTQPHSDLSNRLAASSQVLDQVAPMRAESDHVLPLVSSGDQKN